MVSTSSVIFGGGAVVIFGFVSPVNFPVDFLHRQARLQDVQIEWVNLDETSIPQSFHDSRGNLVSRAWSSQPTPLRLRLGSVTSAELVAASPALQAAL